MNDWKGLNIDNIKEFLNSNVDIEGYVENDNVWVGLNIEDKIGVVTEMLRKENRYRYRLKPLEPIRVTQATYRHLNGSKEMIPVERNKDGKIILFDNRPIEIID